MDYSKLSDFEINSAVSMAMVRKSVKPESKYVVINDYCNNPADSWPIVEVSEIGIVKSPNGWCATNDDAKFEGVYFIDKKPLRAAMIVFLMMEERRNA